MKYRKCFCFLWFTAMASAESFPPIEKDVTLDRAVEHKYEEARGLTRVYNTFLSAVPTATKDLTVDEACTPLTLRNFLARSQSHYDFSERSRRFFQKCEKHLSSKGARSQIFAFLRTSAMVYRFMNRPQFSERLFVTPDGFKIRYQMGLRDGDKAWPLIVVKCGVLCNLDSASLVKYVPRLFDEGPFHVVLVPNVTGTKWVKENGMFTMGGIEEGRELFLLIEHLKNSSPFRHRFSSIHVVSESLGSNAGLFMSLYNTYAEGPVKSLFGGCSVVDMQGTTSRLFERKTLTSWAMFKRMSSDMLESAHSVPVFGRIFRRLDIRQILFTNIYSVLWNLSQDFYSIYSRKPRWAMSPMNRADLSTQEKIYEAHRFQRYAQDVRIPILLWSAAHDAVVNTPVNVGVLQKGANVDRPKSYLQTLVTEKGGHCEQAEFFGWNTPGVLIRSYFERNSPELASRIHDVRISLRPYLKRPWYSRQVGSSERVHFLRWEVEKNRDSVLLVERVDSNRNLPPTPRGTTAPPPWRETKFRVPFALFSQYTAWKIPQSDEEAQAYTRFLNANIDFVHGSEAPQDRYKDLDQIMLRYYR